MKQPVSEMEAGLFPQALLAIPWGHNIKLFQQLKDPELGLWYAAQAAEHGWSRAVLVHQIESELHLRASSRDNNFAATLVAPESDLARELIKDLLFYHIRLHCHVVVELKIEAFKPEHAGKMQFYLAAVDDLLKSERDAPTIGILLCKEKNKVVVEPSRTRQTNRMFARRGRPGRADQYALA